MIIDILKGIVNDIQQKSNNNDDDDIYENYKKQLDIQFGITNTKSTKVIKENQNNT